MTLFFKDASISADLYFLGHIFIHTICIRTPRHAKSLYFVRPIFWMQDEVNLTKTTVNRRSMAKLLIALVNTHDGISKRAR